MRGLGLLALPGVGQLPFSDHPRFVPVLGTRDGAETKAISSIRHISIVAAYLEWNKNYCLCRACSGSSVVHVVHLVEASQFYCGLWFTFSSIEDCFCPASFQFHILQFVIFGAFALSYWYGGQLVEDGVVDFTGVIKCSMALLMGAMGAGEAYSMAGDQAGRAVCVVRKPGPLTPNTACS